MARPKKKNSNPQQSMEVLLANTVALHDLEEAFTYLRRYAKIENAAEEFGYSDGQIEDFCHFASQVMDILKKE